MAIAKVEPLTTARALRGPFDYRLPEAMEGVGVGTVLRVPFGPRRILGVIVEIADRSDLPPERLAEPLEALEAGATPELVRLGLWVAREYCSTPARGLALVLPPGTGRAGGRQRPATDRHAELTAAGRDALHQGARLGAKQRAVLEGLEAAGGSAPARALEAASGASTETLRRLAARGLVELRLVERRRRPESAAVGAAHGPVTLSPAQAAAARAVVAAMDSSKPGELLLHGVTGSGKTEVYLAAVEAALERGLGAIVLVPEIGLTPQALHRFRSRLGEDVAVLHSGLTDGQRFDEWRRLRSGAARVCVGPRSAIFAPIAGLGLIVVDEEHDASYKQESDPRYDARDVARRRAAAGGAALVLGTATPRPETWHSTTRLTLTERADGRPLPPVEVLDMRARGGSFSPLHPRTRDELAALGRSGGKAIVLVNRRGFQVHVSCRECGHVWSCPRCDVSLVSHRSPAALRCHHCGHAEGLPDRCSECGSVGVAHHGAGTERIAELVAEAAGGPPVVRLDSETAGREGHLAILRRFHEAESAVLVGTQMVAKGHDFPDVVLAVVIDADATLRFPDFRAEERAFALVAQLAGRSGRGPGGGSVLVQTLAPEAPAIAHAARHDAAGFVSGELERRRALRYPPFAHLVRVELTSQREDRAAAEAAALADSLRGSLPAGTELLGPAPRFRLRGRHRRQLLLKGAERRPLVDAARAGVDAAVGRRLRDVTIAVDVDGS
jgi:primosomal protein N' (replication factor Y) (superfamily II helicase)